VTIPLSDDLLGEHPPLRGVWIPVTVDRTCGRVFCDRRGRWVRTLGWPSGDPAVDRLVWCQEHAQDRPDFNG